MIQTLEQSRSVKQQNDALAHASKILQPKLSKLLNPNIVDCWIRLTLHIANGDLKYIHDADSQPGYAHHLVEQLDEENCRKVLVASLRTIKSRIEDKIGRGWHGDIVLLLTIAGGESTITSEVDGVHRLG